MKKLLTDIGKKSKKAINKRLSAKKKDKVLKDYRLLILKNKKLIINENKKEVNVWLPTDDWGERSRSDFDKIISKLLNIKPSKNQFFNWSIIKEEDW